MCFFLVRARSARQYKSRSLQCQVPEDTMCSDAKNLDEKSISTANLNKIYPHEKDKGW